MPASSPSVGVDYVRTRSALSVLRAEHHELDGDPVRVFHVQVHTVRALDDAGVADAVLVEVGDPFLETIVPPSYGIPDTGATAKLLNGLGRHLIRPGHIHFKLSHPTCRSLTTQIYFEGDPYIDSDVVGAVKDSLIVALVRSDDATTRCSYDFVLAGRDDA